MKYNEAMQIDKVGWSNDVEKEHDRMVINKIWIPTKLEDVPRGAKVLTSTWAIKKKRSNGKLRTRLHCREYKQIDGMHYDSSDIYAPVTNDTTIRIVMVLALMAG